MTREKSCDLVSVNQTKDLALCFTEQDHLGEFIQAVGRYYFVEALDGSSGPSCEVAFVIKESKRGMGMAKALLSEMAKIALQRGIRKMFACVRRDNKAMLKVFEHAGFVRLAGDELDELKLELVFN